MDTRSPPVDHISQLPDEILECILDNLKLREAVRAGLVSSRWRNLVLSRAHVVFNMSNMFKTDEASRKKCVCSEYKDRFVEAVSQFIASYRGERIDSVFIRFCLKSDSASAVSNWTRFALDSGVEILGVEFYCKYFKDESRLYRIPGKVPIEFLTPSKRTNLKYLRLSYCDAPRSLFSQIESLQLRDLCLEESHHMLSSLVNLKELDIRQCKLPSYLSIRLLTRLVVFSVVLCSGLEEIDLANPKLNTLLVMCKRTVRLMLTGAPNLKVFCYAVHDSGLRHVFSKLPKILPGLVTLAVHSRSNWIEYMPEKIATFSRLRKLSLGLDHKAEDIMCRIVRVLKSCPLLFELSIVLSDREDKEHGKLEPIDDEHDDHHEHLEWILVLGFVGTEYQIESCKYLLKLAPHTKGMVLTFDQPLVLKRVTRAGHRTRPVNEEECESVVNALKASSSNNNLKVYFI